MRSGHNPAMQIPGVHIETLHNPVRYTYAQIEKACAIAQMLNRGKLVLVEPPQRWSRDADTHPWEDGGELAYRAKDCGRAPRVKLETAGRVARRPLRGERRGRGRQRRVAGAKRGTEESNLEPGFWRPRC